MVSVIYFIYAILRSNFDSIVKSVDCIAEGCLCTCKHDVSLRFNVNYSWGQDRTDFLCSEIVIS